MEPYHIWFCGRPPALRFLLQRRWHTWAWKRKIRGKTRLTVPPVEILERPRTFALVPFEVSTSGTSQALVRLTGCSHTHGRGIERIITSVSISDQACARYIMVVSIQVPGAAPILVQFVEIGKHCKRLAAKNAMVHVTVKPIIVHEMTENVLVIKILEWKLACPIPLCKNWSTLPSIEKDHGNFRKSKRHRLR